MKVVYLNDETDIRVRALAARVGKEPREMVEELLAAGLRLVLGKTKAASVSPPARRRRK